MRLPWARLLAVLGYLFVTALVYLAGIYVHRIFYSLYLLLLLLPVLSAAQLLLTLARLRYLQDFDTEHPVKGETIGYRLSIANESFLAGCVIKVRFKAVHPDMRSTLDDFTTVFSGRANMVRSYRISCPYRGIYTVGLESLELRDLLGWITIRREVYHRTFYVYPRLIDLRFPFPGSRAHGLSHAARAAREEDVTLFEGLSDYRAGLPVRHLAWKKFFSTGSPFLRFFGRSTEPGITIYLDLRRVGGPDTTVLEAEDCSVEIAVALVKYFLANRTPTTVKAMGVSLYTFQGSDSDAFPAFYHHTINLVFQHTLSPAALFRDDRRRVRVEGAVLFITHLIDSAVLDLLATTEGESVGAIINQQAMSADSRRRLQSFRRNLGTAEQRLFLVDGADTIREDLEG